MSDALRLEIDHARQMVGIWQMNVTHLAGLEERFGAEDGKLVEARQELERWQKKLDQLKES